MPKWKEVQGCSCHAVPLGACQEAEGGWGTAGTGFVTLSGSPAQEFKCHQLDLLYLPLLEEFILLGDKQTSLADALRILTMPSHASTQTPAKPTVSPKNTSRVARKAVGRQLLLTLFLATSPLVP